mgnify:CR=1 FL=1
MKKYLLMLLVLCPLLSMGQNRVVVTPTGIPLKQAVSGHYAGWIMDKLMITGGCNFPDVPCADGGQKVYYPKAYGASVQVHIRCRMHPGKAYSALYPLPH